MTLSELLVACALSGMVLAGTYVLLEQGVRAHATAAARVETQQVTRAALDRLSREIRTAGRGPFVNIDAIGTAEPSRLVLVSDLNADRRGESVTWHLAGSILRRAGGGGAQPVANGVRAFELRYRDAAGRPTTDREAIRSVEITLRAAPVAGGSVLAPGTDAFLSARVRLRNR
ncbi:MAG: hypothetical protein FJ027_18870 [Candidatus Rokubacteria bacterium]|nr:hypothetical protein [Candidatus Rokubacteria bacterium]